MKCFSFLVVLFFISCTSQTGSQKSTVEFEDVYHHYFTLTPKEYELINSQEKMDQVSAAIRKHYGGKRSAPIPAIFSGENYLIIKPILKNSNDVQILSVERFNTTLHIKVKPFYNPERDDQSRLSPNILLKIYTESNVNKIVINYPN